MSKAATLTDRVDAVIDRAIAEKRIVGTVVLVNKDGKQIYARAAGQLDREAGMPMPRDAIFRLASFTKPIVAAAALAPDRARKIRPRRRRDALAAGFSSKASRRQRTGNLASASSSPTRRAFATARFKPTIRIVVARVSRRSRRTGPEPRGEPSAARLRAARHSRPEPHGATRSPSTSLGRSSTRCTAASRRRGRRIRHRPTRHARHRLRRHRSEAPRRPLRRRKADRSA